METILNPQEVGKGIADFGFLIMAGTCYLVFSFTLFVFFIKWFVRIINNIINKQQQVLEEILEMEQKQIHLLEDVQVRIKQIA
jgi:hypothetical protein